MNKIEKEAMKRMILWTAIGIAISMAINFGMFALLGDAAFPWNIVVLVLAFLGIGFWYQRRMFKKMGIVGNETSKIEYECLDCHVTYKGDRCWRCGKRGGKAIFG